MTSFGTLRDEAAEPSSESLESFAAQFRGVLIGQAAALLWQFKRTF
jgi:hypothetical protein